VRFQYLGGRSEVTAMSPFERLLVFGLQQHYFPENSRSGKLEFPLQPLALREFAIMFRKTPNLQELPLLPIVFK
jgi:hypothetical protein